MTTAQMIALLEILSIIMPLSTGIFSLMVWLRIRLLPPMKYFTILAMITALTSVVRVSLVGWLLVSGNSPGLTILGRAFVGTNDLALLIGWLLIFLFLAGIVNGIHPNLLNPTRKDLKDVTGLVKEPEEFVG